MTAHGKILLHVLGGRIDFGLNALLGGAAVDRKLPTNAYITTVLEQSLSN